jgi:acetyltransferase
MSPKTVTLRDGTDVMIRAVCPQDAIELFAMYRRLSPETIYQRFMGMRRVSYREVKAMCQPDDQIEKRLVAVDADGAIVGETMCARVDAETWEFAILIEDYFQGRGLGRLLFHELIAHARAAGIRHFLVITSGQNRGMIALVRGSGYPFTTQLDGSVLEFMMSLDAEELRIKRAS